MITWNGRECGKFEPSPVAFGRRDIQRRTCGMIVVSRKMREAKRQGKKKNKYTEDAGHDFTRWRSEKPRFFGGSYFYWHFCTNNNDVSGRSSIGCAVFPPSSNKVFLFFFNGHVKSWLLSMRVLFVSHMENDPFENETIPPKWSHRHVVFLFKFSYCRTGRK